MSSRVKDFQVLEQTAIDAIEFLNNTNPDAKDEFISNNDLTVPNNAYGEMDMERVNQNLGILEGRKKEGFSSDPEDEVIQRLMEDNLRQNQFVKLCHRYNGGETTQDVINEHQKLNEALYGLPERQSFNSILGWQLSQIKEKSLMEDELILLDELRKMFPDAERIPPERIYEPSDELFHRFGEICEKHLCFILKHIPDKERFSPQEVCNLANEVFESEFAGKGWKAEVKPAKFFASVNQETKIFNIPGKRSKGEFFQKDVKGLFAHEIGVHILRSIPYQNCKIKAFSTGIPGYLGFEEGLANAVQHSILHEKTSSGHLHYVTLGLAAFYHMNFRQVYEIQWRIQKLLGNANKQQCFDSVQRGFRGTGYLMNSKDLAYFVGYKKAWEFIADNIDSCSLMDDLLGLGKIDVTDVFWRNATHKAKLW